MRHQETYANYPKASNGGYGLSLLCAVGVGVALGLLFAPSDGRRLRGQIRDGAQRLGRRTAEGYSSAQRTVSDMVERGRSAVHTGRMAFDDARSDLRTAQQPPADM
jgi:hypothetical protein